ncbi:MAG: sigma-54-dependent transcriptional regulator, partial [Steroidobacteraceae bacterium]
IHARDPRVPVIFITGHGTAETAIEAMRLGAYDYLLKPLDLDHLREVVRRAIAISRLMSVPALVPESGGEEERSDLLIGNCPAMQQVYKSVGRVAPQDVTVLLRGESGTGKELVARAIYHYSRRGGGPFLAINCAAIPENLLESELFGHVKGAFTGAVDKKPGKFELAEGGTLFLDEISTMDERTQINLLRVLETHAYTRVGGKKERDARVRVLAASNRDLESMVKAGEFREDLYYRLNIFSVKLPPLRERSEDIPVIAGEYLRELAGKYGKQVASIPAETQRLLANYNWPGNVRELRNVIEQAVLLARSSSLDPELLPQMIYRAGPVEDVIRIPLGATMRDAEKEIILRTLEARKGNKKITAEVLGISRRSLYNKLAEYGLDGK